MPDDFRDLQPLIDDTLDDIRARVDADTNAGIPATDPRHTDTTPGLPFYTLTQGMLIEIARVRDLISWEYVAAALLPFSFGKYLDKWGEALDEPRKDEKPASGIVEFTAPNGTNILGGIEVAIAQIDPSADEVVFLTTAATPAGGIAVLAVPSGLSATPQAAGGQLGAGTYYYKVTALVGGHETTPSSEVSATLSATGRIDLGWAAVPGASAYCLYRGNSTGAEVVLATNIESTTFLDYGLVSPSGASPPVTNTTGGVWALPVAAERSGSQGNANAGAISVLVSAVPAVTAVSNPYLVGAGADVETDEAYKPRLLKLFQRGATGSGTIADYERWVTEIEGIGFANVEANWNGAGTVRVTITNDINDPTSASKVAEAQLDIDPVPGKGLGRAPVGAIVTIATPGNVTVTVAGTIVPQSGYTLTGSGGTIALLALIVAAIKAYIDSLPPGGDVLLNRVEAAILSVDGVYNVSGVLLNGSAADVGISALQVATTGTVTLS